MVDSLLFGTPPDTRSATHRDRDPRTRQIFQEYAKPGDNTRRFTPEQRAACVAEAQQRIADGETLRLIAMLPHMPQKSELWRWLNLKENVEATEQAFVASAEVFRDELRDIAEDGSNDYMEIVNQRTGRTELVLNKEHVARSKLRIDTLQWLMKVANQRKYGDRSTVDVNAKVEYSMEQQAGKLGNMLGRLTGERAANSDHVMLPLVERVDEAIKAGVR